MQEPRPEIKKKPEDFKNPHLDSSPIYLPGNEIGVMLVHGYSATPAEVRLLGEYLNGLGYTVLCPLLPGHGTSIDDFSRTKWTDWAFHLEREYAALKSECPAVFVGGESLGALLSIFLGIYHPEISGLILNAPALYPMSWLAYSAPIMRYFIKTKPKKRDSSSPVVDERWNGYNMDAVAAVAEYIKVQRTVKPLLNDIRQPTIIFQGRLDETVKPEGAQEIYDGICSDDKSLVWMENSTHCVLLDREWESIAQQTAEFIRRLTA